MSEESFEVGDLVWVKKENYPLWPAKISQPPKEENGKEEEKMCYVCFLGSETCDWVANKKIQRHAEHLIPPNYEKTSPFLKNAIDEIILLSKNKPFKEVTKASPQVVENLEEKESMVDKQLMEEEQSPIKKRHSYKGDATTLKSKQPSLKEPVKGKQPPVKEKQRISKEPEKEKQPPVEEKQPSSKEPENEKQPPVEEKKVSLKKRVKNNHPLVEEMKLPIKKQRISKKQPSIKENQTSINTNPVREKRKQLEQIASTGKVSKKAGYSVKSPRVVERKRSLSKESVIGETSMSGSVPCSSKIQKIDDDDDSLRSSHSGLSADLSNPKDLKSDDEDSVSGVSSISSSDWHPELLCRSFKTKDDDDDDRSVSSSSSRQSPRCEIVRPRKDEPNFQNLIPQLRAMNLLFLKIRFFFIPDREPSPVDDQYEKRLKMKHLEPTKERLGF
ncbi:hypothetical protein TNCV_4823551 [Trichonephila clavipes]|nr:hypothetical protein TNCV_4823551 [Trichonephila clavipes]